MAVGESLLAFLTQEGLGKQLSEHDGFRGRYEEVYRIASEHSVDPTVLHEGVISAARVYELVRDSERGFVYLQFPDSLQVDPLDDSSGIGDSFGVQLINGKGAQSSWLDSESAENVTVADVRDFGRDLDAGLSSLFEQVQAAWGKPVDRPCFVEALRYELHKFSSKKLHTAYFHSIDLSGRADGPTLVRVETSRCAAHISNASERGREGEMQLTRLACRLEKDAEGDVAIAKEALEVRQSVSLLYSSVDL